MKDYNLNFWKSSIVDKILQGYKMDFNIKNNIGSVLCKKVSQKPEFLNK